MSHYDVKFLAWLSTNLLMSCFGKKTKIRSSGAWEGKTIAEQMGGPLYDRMMRVNQGRRIFDGFYVNKDEQLSVAQEGWESDIYVKHRGALRRARLLRAEIWNEYGPYAKKRCLTSCAWLSWVRCGCMTRLSMPSRAKTQRRAS